MSSLEGHGEGATRAAGRSDHEREYSPSTCIPSIDVELARYTERSEAAASLPHRSLAYGERVDERLVVFDGPAGSPLHVFVHGGYWQALSAADSLLPAPELVGAGHSFAAIDYTLAPHATIGTMIDQCVRALDRVVEDLRPSAITLSGSSAGAHLAAHVAQRTTLAIDRLILLSGMFQLEPLRATTVNDALGLDAAAAEAWSVPLSPRPACQVMIVHGRIETVAFKAQSARLAAAWGVPAVEVDDRNHFDLVHDLAAIDLRLGPPGQDAADGSANAAHEVALVAAAERPGAPRRLALDLLHPTAR